MSDSPRFIVVFKDNVKKEQIQEYAKKIKSNGGEVTHELDLINGLAAHIPASFLGNLQADDVIKYIEPDSVVTTQ